MTPNGPLPEFIGYELAILGLHIHLIRERSKLIKKERPDTAEKLATAYKQISDVWRQLDALRDELAKEKAP